MKKIFIWKMNLDGLPMKFNNNGKKVSSDAIR